MTSIMVRWQHGNEIEESHPLLPPLQWDVTRTGAKSHPPANGDRLIYSQAPDLQFSLLSYLPQHQIPIKCLKVSVQPLSPQILVAIFVSLPLASPEASPAALASPDAYASDYGYTYNALPVVEAAPSSQYHAQDDIGQYNYGFSSQDQVELEHMTPSFLISSFIPDKVRNQDSGRCDPWRL